MFEVFLSPEMISLAISEQIRKLSPTILPYGSICFGL